MVWAIETEKLGMMFRTNWGTKKRALEDLTIQVSQREIFGFLGHNGAGKTTTIKILMGLCHATEGKAFILGESIHKVQARARVGFLPENVSFYEYLTALETIVFYGRLREMSKKESLKRGQEILEEMGLKDALHRRVAEFSKGMRQRLGLAQSMIHNPDILILDEPLTGLDPSGRREMREKIRMLRERGKTIFFSSHVLSDVELLCDRVALLSKGKLIAIGTLDALLGDRITSIEIVGEGCSEQVLSQVKPFCLRTMTQDRKMVMVVENEEKATEVRKILEQGGGKLKALIPHRETLEDFYFRQEGEKR